LLWMSPTRDWLQSVLYNYFYRVSGHLVYAAMLPGRC